MLRYWPTLVLALAVLAAPFIFHVTAPHFEDRSEEQRRDAEIAALREEIAALEAETQILRERVDGLDARTSRQLSRRDDDLALAPAPEEESPGDTLAGAFAQVVLIGDRRDFNEGLTWASPSFLKEFLGLPRDELSDECEEMTNPELAAMLKLEDVGPIRVKLLEPALISLRQIFRNVQVYEPELYERIKSAGSLCVRQVRGAEGRASAHAYGLAVDINIDGMLDTLGDGKTQLGLMILSEFFKAEGWIWGAAFGREDSMHFEVSREKLEQWRRLGKI